MHRQEIIEEDFGIFLHQFLLPRQASRVFLSLCLRKRIIFLSFVISTNGSVNFLPVSTFKIPNTLIALNEGVVTKDSVIVWDKKIKDYESWNKDQTLQTAFVAYWISARGTSVYNKDKTLFKLEGEHKVYASLGPYSQPDVFYRVTALWRKLHGC